MCVYGGSDTTLEIHLGPLVIFFFHQHLIIQPCGQRGRSLKKKNLIDTEILAT